VVRPSTDPFCACLQGARGRTDTFGERDLHLHRILTLPWKWPTRLSSTVDNRARILPISQIPTERKELVPGAKKVESAHNSLYAHSRMAPICLLVGVKNEVVAAAR